MFCHTQGIGRLAWGPLTLGESHRQVHGITSAKKSKGSTSKKRRRNKKNKNARVGSEAPDDVLSSDVIAAPMAMESSPKSGDMQKPETLQAGPELGWSFLPKEEEPRPEPFESEEEEEARTPPPPPPSRPRLYATNHHPVA